MSGSDIAGIDIPRNVLADIYDHARAGHPEEVCGLLIGPRAAAAVDEVRRCENRQNELHRQDPVAYPRDGRTAYNLGTADLYFVGKSLRGERPVKIIYHSHVDVGAYFSDEDKRAALWDGELRYEVDYLVIDAGPEGARGAKLFRYRDGDFVEIAAYPPIEVESEASETHPVIEAEREKSPR